MRISVALPTYRGGTYLRQQLESIQQQTRRPDELIITDDASGDDTIVITEEFQKTASFPVKILSNFNRLGCNRNFAEAIARCGGDIIALSDQDDVWKSRHLERLIAPFERDQAVSLVVSNSDFVDEDLQPTGITLWKATRFNAADARRLNRGPALREWVKHHVIAGHASAFRAKLAPAILPFAQSTYDQWLGLVCAACGKVVMIDEILTLQHHHANQTIGHRQRTLAKRALSEKTVSMGHFEAQIEELGQLISRLECHPEVVWERDYQKILHERIDLLEQRRLMRNGVAIHRAITATRLLLSGRYHRNGRGLLTYARDLRG